MRASEKVTLPWQNLREWDGSVRKAFEQMCNQFAACEEVPDTARFVPVAAPDGGVEGYWLYDDESEWGFQAKFWTSPDQVDFSQLDKSVRRALETHPNLNKYTVCLPIDRQDPRAPDQQWLKDIWDRHVAKWERWASQKKMSVEFDYWGETQLTTRFSLERHAGRYYFWFNKDLFSDAWFKERLEEARANVDVRYTEGLNVSLELSRVFDGLVRGAELFKAIRGFAARIRKVGPFRATPEIEFAATGVAAVQAGVDTLQQRLASCLNTGPTDRMEITSMAEAISGTILATHAFSYSLRNYEAAKKKQIIDAATVPDITAVEHLRAMLGLHTAAANKLIEVLEEMSYFVESEVARAADAPAILLMGDAGTGKTHLLCDFAFSQLDIGAPVLLLLGQHFLGTDTPWSQAANQLGIRATPAEFLGALNAAGQLRGVPTVLIIDAINEGLGRRLWHGYLAGMLTAARRYPYVRIVFSVRRTYLDACIPASVSGDDLLRVEHNGFADNVIDAVKAFFDHYKIVLPSAPILDPEFANPLFLKIFCLSLFNRGQRTVPKGLNGMNAVFGSFIESIDEKLWPPGQLDYPKESKLVRRAADRLADAMAADGSRWVSFDEADKILKNIYHSSGYAQSLLFHLISEGLVSKDMRGSEEAIQFSYERMSDYLIAQRLLEQRLAITPPEACFLPRGPLHFLVESESAASSHQGLLEAISVHLPERYGLELADVVGRAREYRAVRGSFVATFALRSEEAFSVKTETYVNEVIARYKEDRYQLNEALMSLAPLDGHPFNAKSLHRTLSQLSLPDRDVFWTATYLWQSFERRGTARRLVEWTTGEAKLDILDEPSRHLIGLSLGWILTSSNRTQRDTATKGLVRLFTDHLGLLLPVLQVLADVNDPYVVERILAASYGASMRSRNDNGLRELAQWAYDTYFANRQPPPNILIRDYARGIVEWALHRGVSLRIESENIRPPYKSKWPTSIPSRKSLEKRYGWSEGQDKEVRQSWFPIFDSVMEHGDFARYVIGTNWGSFPWLAIPLSKPQPKNTSRYGSGKENKPFDIDVAQRWIFDRVVKLGWTPEKFKVFDRQVTSHYDREDKPERIGKKYQWIAYYELVALVADHYYYSSTDSDPGDQRYDGPWQVTAARNIDPSSLLTRDHADEEGRAWWLKLDYSLPEDEDLDSWLRNGKDVPDLAPMLQANDPENQTQWLVLEGSCKVSDPRHEGEQRFAHSFRQVWVEVRAFLVKKEDEEEVFIWLGKESFWGRWLHESHGQTGVFLGEFHWAPASRAIDNDYNGHPGWSKEHRRGLPREIADTCSQYLRERGYDCSVDESINLDLPSKVLGEGLKLAWSGRDCIFDDEEGRPAAFDPSATLKGPRALLVRRDLMEKYLASEGLALVWAAFGGKQYMRSDRDRDDWRGEMQMNGAYRLVHSGVEGRFRGEFRTKV